MAILTVIESCSSPLSIPTLLHRALGSDFILHASFQKFLASEFPIRTAVYLINVPENPVGFRENLRSLRAENSKAGIFVFLRHPTPEQTLRLFKDGADFVIQESTPDSFTWALIQNAAARHQLLKYRARLDVEASLLITHNKKIKLTRCERLILACLMEHRSAVELERKISRTLNKKLTFGSLKVHIHNLRRKLADSSLQITFNAESGAGYQVEFRKDFSV